MVLWFSLLRDGQLDSHRKSSRFCLRSFERPAKLVGEPSSKMAERMRRPEKSVGSERGRELVRTTIAVSEDGIKNIDPMPQAEN